MRRARPQPATRPALALSVLWALLPLLALSPAAVAQPLPSAGGQLQQIPPSPAVPPPAQDIRLVEQPAVSLSPADSGLRVHVRTLRIRGAQVYSEQDLLALTGFRPDSELTLADLQAMAARITAHYRQHGYFVAQAYLPAQEVQDQTLTIAVTEGRYGHITLNNQAGIADWQVRTLTADLQPGQVIAARPLERALLLLSDLPGVSTSSTLVPGAAAGSSDLLLDLAPGARLNGSIDADNAGNRYTGAYRLGATVNLNNPMGWGDVASLRVLNSGSGLRYARASYQVPFGATQVGVAYSRLDYALGREFDSLGASGRAEVVSLYGRHALLRSRSDNLYVQLALDARRFHDAVDASAFVLDKRTRVATISLYGDRRDEVMAGAVSAFSLAGSLGDVQIRTPAVREFDAVTGQSAGRFSKLVVSAMRLQRIAGPFSLYGAVRGQLASKNLDVSEKMELGGINGVRAYPEGEAFADQGYLVTLEARLDLPAPSHHLAGQWQAMVFADTGGATADKNPWLGTSRQRRLSGAGAGLEWTRPGDFTVRTFYAAKLGSAKATSAPDRSGRLWVQLVKYF
ncbi:MAG: ShlB/FhaC/HecB family hemolysin secretion/activation protein [Pseudoxanthomonas sp.]